MSDSSRSQLIQELIKFSQKGSHRSLCDFQRLAGWLNWALNVYPLLRPGLSALYAKTAGKLVLQALIWVNRDVIHELNWIIDHLHLAEGIFFFKLVSWSFQHLPQEIFRVYTDASGDGLTYWFLSLNIGFQSPLLGSAPTGTIFYYEALAVTAGILDAVTQLGTDHHLVVFTNNLNTVSMFNSLTALPPYNWLLMASVDAIMNASIDFRVFFIPGVNNIIADHLSHWKNSEACAALLGLSIHPFTPPQNMLGAAKK